jgi:hypothetical protein
LLRRNGKQGSKLEQNGQSALSCLRCWGLGLKKGRAE